MSSRNVWPYYASLNWARYTERIMALLEAAGALQNNPELTALESGAPGLYASFNWLPYEASKREPIRARSGDEGFVWTTEIEIDANPVTADPDTGELTSHYVPPTLPRFVAAFVTIRVPVSDLRDHRDVDSVLRAIKGVLLDALENRPKPDEAPEMAMTTPIAAPRRYLLARHEESFRQDVARLKLYRQGLSFRQIAYIESRAAVGDSIDPANVPGVIGEEIANERGVAESVRLSYEAVFLRPPPEENPWRSERPSAPEEIEKSGKLPGEVPFYEREHVVDSRGALLPVVMYRERGVWRQRTTNGSDTADTSSQDDLPGGPPVSRGAGTLSNLSPIERSILYLRLGLAGEGSQMDYEAVGRRFGLSVDRVREIESRALASLREVLEKKPPSMS